MFKYLGIVLCNHGDKKRNKREGCERQMCHRITYKGYERKECVHEGKERISILLPTLMYDSENWT